MRTVLDVGGEEVEIELETASAAATVADLVAALAGGPGQPPAPRHGRHPAPERTGRRPAGDLVLLLDGEPAPPTRRLAVLPLHPGARLALVGRPPATAARRAPSGPAGAGGPAPAEVRVIGGLAAGVRYPLAVGSTVVGHGPDAGIVLDDPTVSARHARFDVTAGGRVTVSDLGSRNGVWCGGRPVTAGFAPGVDDVLALGAVAVVVGTPAAHDGAHLGPAGADGGRSFHRPPPTRPPPLPPPVAVPEAAPAPAPPARFGWAGALAPLALGLVMAKLFSPVMAAFALLSPVMVVAGWVEDRRRHRRERDAGAATDEANVSKVARDLAAAGLAEQARRRLLLPDAAEVARRALDRSKLLWARRPGADDFATVRLGTGSLPWDPPTSGGPARGVTRSLLAGSRLEDVPIGASLGAAAMIGLAGPRPAVVALARSLVLQTAVHHGPADARIAVAGGPTTADQWRWTAWLPHARWTGGDSTASLLASGTDEVHALVAALAALRDDRLTVLVVDDPGLLSGRRSALAGVVAAGRPVAVVVLAPSPAMLPAGCTTVVVVDEHGWASAPRLDGDGTGGFLTAGLVERTARRCAMALATLGDPEAEDEGADLPGQVRLLDLVDLPELTASALADRWGSGLRSGLRLATPIGVRAGERAADPPCPLVLDLVADGPHALVAGTTGSGKSELLRSLVAGLASSLPPDQVTFLLVDYKGGAAFAECRGLPHVLGVITDLDGHACRRALRSLEAELRFRERVLAGLGIRDLADHPAYRRADGADGVAAVAPLPQLVVVVDEFAVLAGEQPDFLAGLVGVTVRGRSLGMHLVLGTQRPAGVVSPVIRANTSCRIALRVQDASDSADVIGVPDACRVDRRQPGRGLLRLGEHDVTPFQAALCTGAHLVGPGPPVVVRPARVGPPPACEPSAAEPGKGSDLAALVEAAADAARRSGRPSPRRPWVEPLPAAVDLDEVDHLSRFDGGGGPEAVRDADVLEAADRSGPLAGRGAPSAVLGLADDPDGQARRRLVWDAAAGNLLVVGTAGSGVTTTLTTVATSLATTCSPDRLHLYCVDHGSGGLAPLAALPHTGAVVQAGEVERTHRLVSLLTAALDTRRRHLAGGGHLDDLPRIVLLVDNLAGLRAAFDDLAGLAVIDGLDRVVSDGPGLGIHTVLAADRVGAVPVALFTALAQKLVLRLADRQELHALGLGSTEPPPALPGRGLDAGTRLEIQVARPTSCARLATRWPAPTDPPPSVLTLPLVVERAELVPAMAAADGVRLPLGLCGTDLTVADLALAPGDHALIAGGARSGKSTTLAALAAGAVEAGIAVIAVALRPSPLRDVAGLDDVVRDLAAVPAAVARAVAHGQTGQACLLFVDDAELVDDGVGLDALVSRRSGSAHVIAAGRPDALRCLYGHWTTGVRRCGLGVVLRPASDLDGDVLGLAVLPRTPVPAAVGRGWSVAQGQAELVQVAR
jgi:S-DNA-T family DNA segregation ATPase FtsK/SpoIIIE